MVKTDCVEFVDNRGPYVTQERCFDRVQEMVHDIGTLFPENSYHVMWRCTEVKQGSPT